MWGKTVPCAWPVRSNSSHIEFSQSPVLKLLEEMRNTLAYDYVPVSRVSQEKHNESSTKNSCVSKRQQDLIEYDNVSMNVILCVCFQSFQSTCVPSNDSFISFLYSGKLI